MSIVGFDFGTTNSLISVIRRSKPIHFLDEERRPIPSIVCYEGAQKILGREAKERLAQAGLGVHGNVVRSPKMYLGRDSVFVEGVERSPVDIVADVVGHVLREARSHDLGDINGAVVTIPVDMQGGQRLALRNAFRLAGLRIVQFVHEPLAALYGLFRSQNLPAMLRRYDKKLVLVFDWGGGTLDLTLCRPLGDSVIQIMNDGTDEVGGDIFDQAIMNRLMQNVMTMRGLDDTVGVQPGARARLLDRCERAKIDLSSRSNVSIYVGNFFQGIGESDLDYSLSQGELEKIVAPMLDKGFKRIEEILKSSGYAPEQVALCVGTGGMSNMPAVQRRLHEWFGPGRVQIPDGTATLIAEGAAWIAADEVGLQLAKNVELLLARQSYLPLVKAGTAMPKETEVQTETFHLYCTDPRDGVAKFQICAPTFVGSGGLPSEPRTHLQNLTVKVDAKARPFQERLELDVRIDDNLILEVHARSLNLKDGDRCEIHNLEFGLTFPRDPKATKPTEDHTDAELLMEAEASVQITCETALPTLGALSVRANVADRVNPLLVPGEFLYEYDPEYFDVRRHPPEHQERERLYYQRCSLCRRTSNDPACQCSTLRPAVCRTAIDSHKTERP
jgi:molecular chaperone DnaK (HSP70)